MWTQIYENSRKWKNYVEREKNIEILNLLQQNQIIILQVVCKKNIGYRNRKNSNTYKN